MLINSSLSSETSALESAGLRSSNNLFHDLANKTPLKLSYGVRAIIKNENEWARYSETVSLFVPVCAREAETQTQRSGRRVLFVWKKNLLRVPSLHAAESQMLSFFYDTTFQSFCQGGGDKALNASNHFALKGIQGKIQWLTVLKVKLRFFITLSPHYSIISVCHKMPWFHFNWQTLRIIFDKCTRETDPRVSALWIASVEKKTSSVWISKQVRTILVSPKASVGLC